MSRFLLAVLLTVVFGFPAIAASDPDICYRETGEKAIAACNRVINSGRYKRDDVADAHLNRGQEWYARRELDKAIADFSDAIRLKPGMALSYGNRGNCHYLKKDYDRALADYSRAIEIDPDFASAYTSRGLIYKARDDLEKARAQFNAALKSPKKYQDGEWAHTTARKMLDDMDKEKK